MADGAHDDQSAGESGTEELAGGSYEVIRGRLVEQAKDLGARASKLNEARMAEFGGTELTVIGNERIRTENNCLPRDIIQVQGRLWFGYNVFIGLKTETTIQDVFSLHSFATNEDGEFDLSAVPLSEGGDGFLTGEKFTEHFHELYRFYKDAKLVQLSRTETKLLAVVQTGGSISDVRVFHWNLDVEGQPTYVDNRGEREYQFPPQHDFEWQVADRDNQVEGVYPHISILDQVFVETTGGDLTIKVENNTESGEGIYAEPVEEASQTLDDAEFQYAPIGPLILLKIKPYREEHWRHLVFSTRSHNVVRIDPIGQACVSLPEDHGVMFPSGYFLQDGQYKVFDGDYGGFEFQRSIRSPNGEDVLYVFNHREAGIYALFPYNMIRREVQSPIRCNGYSLFDDGRMVVFRFSGDEPTRVHGVQIWQTPFVSAEHAAKTPSSGTLLGKIGNAELVRGISDCLSIRKFIDNQKPSRQVYEDLIASLTRTLDAYYWLAEAEVGEIKLLLEEIRQTAELIVDEFEKVVAIRAQAEKELAAAIETQEQLVRDLLPDSWSQVDQFMGGLTRLRTQRGHLITLRELKYMDVARIDELEAEVVEQFDKLSSATVDFLLKDDALKPLVVQLDELMERVGAVEKTNEINPIEEKLESVGEGLNVLSEVAANLQVDDPTARTHILDQISEVFGHQNRVRATVANRRKELGSAEGRAEFSAQFKLFSQSVTSSIAMADTPEKCDEQLSRLMVQLEELEAKFSEFDEFVGDLTTKREEVYEAFGQKKQQLLDERQRRVQNLWSAAERILSGVGRRASKFKDTDELNAYFASDAMILKLRELAERIVDLGDSVKADEVQSKLKSSKQDALRGLRDRLDLFEDGAALIKLGTHRFSVNTQSLELTILPQGEDMAVSLSGTDFLEPIDDDAFNTTRDYWEQQLISETREVYRGEYLAASILFNAEADREGFTLIGLHEAQRGEGGLLELVRKYAAARYQEGYERGVHDVDATAILERLLALRDSAGLLRFAPTARGLACLFWAFFDDTERAKAWHRRAQSMARLRSAFNRSPDAHRLVDELVEAITQFVETTGLEIPASHAPTSARYLMEELGAAAPRFTSSAEAQRLVEGLYRHLDGVGGARREFSDDLRALEGRVAARFSLARAWLRAFVESSDDAEIRETQHAISEAAALLVSEREVPRETNSSLTVANVTELLGQHPRIESRQLTIRVDEFLERLGAFKHERVPGYQRYRQVRQELIERERHRLRIDEYKPRVLTSFVRNKLINDVYLPLIGDNLAKQLGAAGESKRTDLMGLLLLISPPGYGKTTLMEYVASRLGLAFVKVNGPSLGHSVHSLDPQEAPNATARQEVNKINLSFEMGNNVMLYLDDIQHTHPELLQKFISLCDAQRRIEGIWKGRTRTYDLRGKKFCVVMAGNPYTEAGEKFQIPDMLANRADTYNLGDILSGKDDLFALSYIENALTSNPVLAPLATREQSDVYKLVAMAQGEEVPTTDLAHGYSAVEVGEIVAVFQRLFKVQDVLLKVNMQYIASASMDDNYRTEPRFQLQGSYRNMAKLAEKIVPAMNEEELDRLIDDHYVGESQTLTSGAEHNLLKFAELRGNLTGEQRARWEQIKKDFKRVKVMGGGEDDPVSRVTGQLSGLGDHLEGIGEAVRSAGSVSERLAGIEDALKAARQMMVQQGVQESKAAQAASAAQATAAQQLAQLAAVSQAGQEAQTKQMAQMAQLATQSQAALHAQAQQLAAQTHQVAQLAQHGQAAATGQSQQIDQLVAALQSQRPVAAGPPANNGQQGHERDQLLINYLQHVAQALQALSSPNLNVQIQNQPPPGIEELLAQQVAIIERTLVPLVRATNEHMGNPVALDGHVQELLKLMRQVDQRLREGRTGVY